MDDDAERPSRCDDRGAPSRAGRRRSAVPRAAATRRDATPHRAAAAQARRPQRAPTTGRSSAIARGWVSRDSEPARVRGPLPRLRGAHRRRTSCCARPASSPAGRAAACSASRSTRLVVVAARSGADPHAADRRRLQPAAAASSCEHDPNEPRVRARARRLHTPDGACASREPSHDVRDRDRRGHDRRARVRGRRATAGRGHARTASSRSTSRSRAGSSTTPTTSGASRSRRSPRSRAELARRRRDDRRDRHHEPARDRRGVGPRAPAGPRHRAIVWQDRRTAARCDELRAAGHEPMIRARDRARARPVLLGDEARVAAARRRRRRPTPTSCSAPSTRGSSGTSPAAPTAACTRPIRRTRAARCSTTSARASGRTSCATLFDVPRACLPEVAPSSGRFGVTAPERAAGLAVPVSGIAGDQQAALFGQACVEPGMTKNTYGTGSFVLTNVGATLPEPVDGLLTTVAWSLGRATRSPTRWKARSSSPAPRCSGCATASASSPTRRRPARSPRRCPTPAASTSCPRSPGSARRGGTRTRAARSSASRAAPTRAHLARAVVESMAFQTADVVDAITRASGTAPAEMRVDGGASVMDLLCQFQADLLGVPVRRAAVQETTALGAAFLAGIAEGVWDSPADGERDVDGRRVVHARDGRRPSATRALATWHRAVERSRDWARDEPTQRYEAARSRACGRRRTTRRARSRSGCPRPSWSRTCRRTRSPRAGRSRTSPRR